MQTALLAVRGRWTRLAALSAAAVLLGWQLGVALAVAQTALGHDYRLYMGATRLWLSGGPFYHPYQLAGPYPIVDSEVLYPPVALWLLAPFTVLPQVLWWAVPLGVIAWRAARWRPSAVGVTAAMLLLCLPVNPFGYGQGVDLVVNGNPAMWSAAMLALALDGAPWAGPLVLLKPTLAPFALAGLRAAPRAWLSGLALLAALSLALLPMWADYARVLLDAQGGRGLLYPLADWPAMAAPVVLWAGRRARVTRS